MTDRTFRVALLLLLVLPGVAVAQDGDLPSAEQYRIRVEYREYRPSLTGMFQLGNGVTAGSEVDLEDDLGITDQRSWEIHGAIQFRPGHKIRFSYTHVDYDANVPELDQALTIGDTRFARFSSLTSSAKGAFYTAEYEWDFVKGSRGYLGALLGAKALDVDWLILSPPSQREADTLRSIVPSIGAAGRVYAGRLSLDGEISGLTIGSLGSTFEAQASARVNISDRLALQGGYRLIKQNGEKDLDSGNMRMSGFTFGVELSL
jgi:hypothetical protein